VVAKGQGINVRLLWPRGAQSPPDSHNVIAVSPSCLPLQQMAPSAVGLRLITSQRPLTIMPMRAQRFTSSAEARRLYSEQPRDCGVCMTRQTPTGIHLISGWGRERQASFRQRVYTHASLSLFLSPPPTQPLASTFHRTCGPNPRPFHPGAPSHEATFRGGRLRIPYPHFSRNRAGGAVGRVQEHIRRRRDHGASV
jgi:hypothetical protein